MDPASLDVWFLTGSQALYGPETLRQVEAQSSRVVAGLVIGGVQRAWGRGKKAVPIHLCEYHLITKGRAALGRDGIGYGHPTNELLHQALATPAGWDAFAHAVYRSCKRRGMRAPVLAVGDGALGFWKAIREVFPDTAEQPCWFHLASNVLAALSKSADPGAKAALAEIWGAEDKDHALAAVAAFEDRYGAKWPKATAKITDHVDTLLAFYDYPAEHWIHLRTTNPIESTFATVRLRQRVTKGPGSRAAGVAMAFKLLESAQARWRAVNAPHLVALVRAGARFEKGKLVERPHEPGGDRQVA